MGRCVEVNKASNCTKVEWRFNVWRGAAEFPGLELKKKRRGFDDWRMTSTASATSTTSVKTGESAINTFSISRNAHNLRRAWHRSLSAGALILRVKGMQVINFDKALVVSARSSWRFYARSDTTRSRREVATTPIV